jgi:hypothetical protein
MSHHILWSLVEFRLWVDIIGIVLAVIIVVGLIVSRNWRQRLPGALKLPVNSPVFIEEPKPPPTKGLGRHSFANRPP